MVNNRRKRAALLCSRAPAPPLPIHAAMSHATYLHYKTIDSVISFASEFVEGSAWISTRVAWWWGRLCTQREL